MRFLHCALSLLLCIALAGCRSDITYRVLLVGDSLAVNAQPQISQKLLMSDDAGFALLSNAISATSFSHANSGAQYWIERGGLLLSSAAINGVVVSLGTNDAMANENPDQRISLPAMKAALARFMDLYGAGGRPVFWVVPHSMSPDTRRLEVLATINATAALYPQMRLIDMEAAAAARGVSFASLLQTDGVHYTAQGDALLAEIIHAALAADAHARGLD